MRRSGSTERETMKWWRRRMLNWALLWRKQGSLLAMEHAIQNRDIANRMAGQLQDNRGDKGIN